MVQLHFVELCFFLFFLCSYIRYFNKVSPFTYKCMFIYLRKWFSYYPKHLMGRHKTHYFFLSKCGLHVFGYILFGYTNLLKRKSYSSKPSLVSCWIWYLEQETIIYQYICFNGQFIKKWKKRMFYSNNSKPFMHCEQRF